ncbi:MAG: protein kinase [Pirellulales bacterium]
MYEGDKRLGDFALVREIGRGGMGIVYEARQISLYRRVALKVLSGSLRLTPKAVKRFRREAEAAAKLHHTNIVPVYSIGEEDGTHFYSMELIEGPSLDHVIRQLRETSRNTRSGSTAPAEEEPLAPELAQTGAYVEGARTASTTAGLSSSSLGSGTGYFDTVARMIAEVADALEYAHQEGVIHRDMKPSNLLLSPTGRLSVNDFGLARILEQPGMTMSGEFMGTPAYMSPEQIAAGRTPLDHRTDIYSLGATLYELLTLQPPFTGQQRDQVLAQILHKEPKAPRKLNAKVPVDLETICLKALEKDPDRRYQSAGAMAEDLRRYVNRFAISARRAGPVQHLVKWVRRRPALAVSLVGVVLAVGAALSFAYLAHRSEQQRQIERLQADERLREEQKRALMTILDEKIRNAYLVATSGDLKATDTAIMEIEKLGASAGQTRLLRGMVAYFRQDAVDAIRELEQAVELLPDSVAARALLAISYVDSAQFDKYEQTRLKMMELQPSSPEDYLFRGYAREAQEPGQGLEDVNEGIQRRDSPLGRALRTFVWTNRAMDSGKQEDAAQALADADVARGMRPDNPMVLYACINARLVAANIYREAKLDEKRAEVLAKAAQEVEAIKAYVGLPNPDYAIWHYYEVVGEPDKALDLSRRSLDQTGSSVAAINCVLSLYRQGKIAEALASLDQRRQTDVLGNTIRVFLLAESADNLEPAIDEYEKLAQRYPKNGWELRFRSYVLMFLGRKEDARACLRDFETPFADSSEWKEFYEAMRKFGTGELSEEGYLTSAGVSRWKQCYADFEIGLFRLADGDREGAKEYFLKAVNTRAIWLIQWPYSLMFLSRLEQDPSWPKWIPLKKDQTISAEGT